MEDRIREARGKTNKVQMMSKKGRKDFLRVVERNFIAITT